MLCPTLKEHHYVHGPSSYLLANARERGYFDGMINTAGINFKEFPPEEDYLRGFMAGCGVAPLMPSDMERASFVLGWKFCDADGDEGEFAISDI